MKGLTEGRIVHFVTDDGIHREAIISHIWSQENGCVNLFVFPDGSYPLENNTPTSVAFDPDGKCYSWHWPEQASPVAESNETKSAGGFGDIVVTLNQGVDSISIEGIQQIEKAVDDTLDRFGYARISSAKTNKWVEWVYRLFALPLGNSARAVKEKE